MQQLLWMETLIKLFCGVMLALFPLSTATVLGLARSESGFWLRLLGATLIGIAGATFIEGALKAGHGLGVAGCLLINLCVAAMLGSLLVLGKAATSRRGRILLWMMLGLLVMLALFEIAFI